MNTQRTTKGPLSKDLPSPEDTNPSTASKTLGVRLLKTEAQELEEIAERHHTTASQLLRWAITSFVEYYQRTGQWLDVPALRLILKQQAGTLPIKYGANELPPTKVAEDAH